MFNRRQVLAVSGAMLAASTGPGRAQQKTEILLSRQPGILYMPLHVIEKQKLIEKHAARLGAPGVSTKWISFANGGAQIDALISGSVDLVVTGTGPLLLTWDRTKGGIKGIVTIGAQPLMFISREARIKALSDIGPGDKIAVPTVKVSTQAILLQMAASQMFGPENYARFDPNTVQMGHPDAVIALSNASHEVRSHFSAPPFQTIELKRVPGAHIVANSPDIMGGPLTQGQFFTSVKFADANPKIVLAVRAAAEEAKAFIESDRKTSVEIYREITGDKTAVEELLEVLEEPGMMELNIYPQGTMKFAQHLHRTGTLRMNPASWKDYYLPVAHDLPGS